MSTWRCHLCGTTGTAPDQNAAGKAYTDHYTRDCPQSPSAQPSEERAA